MTELSDRSFHKYFLLQCVWTCVFVSACVWRPEGNVGCNALRRHSFCCLREGLSLSWNSLIWLGSWPVSSRDPFLCLPRSGITSIPSCFTFLCVFWELDWCHYAYPADVSHDWGVSLAVCIILSFLLSCMCMYVSTWMCVFTYVSALAWVDVCWSLKLMLGDFFDHFLLYWSRQGLGIELRAHWFS